MIRLAAALIAMLVLAPLATTDAAPTAGGKLPVPDAAAQQQASKEILEVFGDQLTKAQTPDDKRALAGQFISTADQTKDDPVSRYLLLEKALDLSEQAGDTPQVIATVDRIEKGWQVDGLEIMRQGLLKVSARLTGPDDRTRFIGSTEALAHRAENSAQFQAADQFNEIALTAAQAAGDADKIKEIAQFSASVRKRAAAFAATGTARATLKIKPDDPQANLIVGKYECFIEENWNSGLPKLAHGGNPALTALVAKDHAGATADPAAQYALGQAWWQLSDQQQAPAAIENIRRRAAGWYQLAAPGLTGLELTQAQTRLKQLAAAGQTPLSLAPRQAGGESPPTTGAPGAPIVIVNYTDAKEAADVIASVAKNYPAELKGVGEADLLKYYDGSAMQRKNGELATIAGSYSATAAKSNGPGVFVFGPYEERGPGKYLIVYRLQTLSAASGAQLCFLDINCGDVKCGGRRPKDTEFTSGQWSDIPVRIDLNEPTKLEYRLWPFDHMIALDRIYVFELP